MKRLLIKIIILSFTLVQLGCMYGIFGKSKSDYFFEGRIYLSHSAYEMAVIEFSDAIERYPNSYEAYFYRGVAYYFLHSYDYAILDFNKTIEIYPSYNEAYEYRGITYFQIKIYDKAIADLNIALQKNPNSSKANSFMGMVYLSLKSYDDARYYFEKSIRISQYSAHGYFGLGLAHAGLKSYNKSVKYIHKALELDSTTPYGNEILGFVYLEKKDLENALINFNQHIALCNKQKKFICWRAKLGLSIIKYMENKYDVAEILLRDAIEEEVRINEGMKGIEQLEKEDEIYKWISNSKEILKEMFEARKIKNNSLEH